jgi:PKD domain-containing protein
MAGWADSGVRELAGTTTDNHRGERSIAMVKKRFAAVLATAAVAGMLGVGAAQTAGASPARSASPKVPQALSVTAQVIDQQCQGGDFVNVTLDATAQSTSPVRFAWDFTNNGSFDTGRLRNPMVTHLYPDEVNVTARVGAGNAEGNRVADTVSFSTLRCSG